MKTQTKRTDVVAYDFTITHTTKSGQKMTATIPAGTSHRQLSELFEMVGYPAFLYTKELNL